MSPLIRPAPPEAFDRPLRLPDKNDPIERHLDAAAKASRTIAVARLEALLPGLPLDRFAQTTDSATLHRSVASPELLESIAAVGLLDEIFTRRGLRSPQLKLFRDGEPLATDSTVVHDPTMRRKSHVRVGLLASAMVSGYTAVLDGIDLRHRYAANLAELFERVFDCRVNINGYLSERDHSSFGAHWDDHEVVIIQLVGSKDWEVQAPIDLSMTRSTYDKDTSGTVMWAGRLDEGDVLYIPRGWGHEVRGRNERSFHFTVTIPRLSGLGLLHLLVGSPDPLLTMPIDISNGGLVDAHDWATLARAFDADAIGRALAHHRFSTPSRSTQSLSDSLAIRRGALGRAVDVRSPYPGGWMVAGWDDDRLNLAASGRVLTVPNSMVPDLAALSDGTVRRVEVDEQLAEFARAGVLDVTLPPS